MAQFSGEPRGKVLVVDDDEAVRRMLRRLLELASFDVIEASDGRVALQRLYEIRPNLVLLDVSMPALDGWQVLERIRELTDVPVLMLTGSGAELEKVRGLRAGADDYVTKPFGRQELLARVEAILRRRPQPAALPEGYDDGVIAVDFAAGRATAHGDELALTPLELRLLGTLVAHAGRFLSPDQLLELTWSPERSPGRDQVRLYVSYLRRKLGRAGDRVETRRGLGYRYRPPRPDEVADHIAST